MPTWIEALKIYNAGGSWCVPRKGTDTYNKVLAIMRGEDVKEYEKRNIEEKRKIYNKFAGYTILEIWKNFKQMGGYTNEIDALFRYMRQNYDPTGKKRVLLTMSDKGQIKVKNGENVRRKNPYYEPRYKSERYYVDEEYRKELMAEYDEWEKKK